MQYIWLALLTIVTAVNFVVLLRHRKYFLRFTARLKEFETQIEPLKEWLPAAAATDTFARLRREWTEKPPLGDPAIQAECLDFLRRIEELRK